MKYCLSMLFLGLLFMSCGKDEVTAEDQLLLDTEAIQKYLADNNLTAQSTSSGLHYIIEEAGEGGHPDLFSTVIVNYKGYYLDGTVFDETPGSPISFPLSNVIVGWQEGIPLFQKGGKGVILVPSYLAYGTRGQGPIPANTPLAFDVELINFN